MIVKFSFKSCKPFLFVIIFLLQFSNFLEAKISVDLKKYTESVKILRKGRPEVIYLNEFKQPKKENTVIIYTAADNNLFPFVNRMIADLQEIGSNEYLNILIHLNIQAPNKPKVTKRLYIEKNRIIQIGPDKCMNSGCAETCKEAFRWAINDFPSDRFIPVFWNHGTGDLSPQIKRIFDPSKLFRYNPETRKIELDRSITFSDFIYWHNAKKRVGICFDETHCAYLDDKQLIECFKEVCDLRNKKIDVIIFDTCFMAGTATLSIVAPYAEFVVFSEEAELGPGYDYYLTLYPLSEGKISLEEFSRHVVASFKEAYHQITDDYTHSAVKLAEFETVNRNIDVLSQLLIEAINNQKGNSVKNTIKRARAMATCFDEPSYMDLCDFLSKLLNNTQKIKLVTQSDTKRMISKINRAIEELINSIKNMIIANVAGKNLSNANGVSAYFPERQMRGSYHNSYYETEYGKKSGWAKFLKKYHNLQF